MNQKRLKRVERGKTSKIPERRNRKPALPSADARPWDNHPLVLESHHAGKTALCPAMSLAPERSHNRCPSVLLWVVGPLFAPDRYFNSSVTAPPDRMISIIW